uniref:Putative aminotransferase n=1 Tax=Sphaerisporangium sp. SANK 60911 TaxID=1354075 RepID=V5YT94_9ACTN|nr:putative aminotransferase [Sphaerisporangium sp. SANK 60911]
MSPDSSDTSARRHLWHPWKPWVVSPDELTLVRGAGYRVWDDRGGSYIDATSSSLNATCGYGHPSIVGAATRQLSVLHHFDLSVATHRPAGLLAERIADLLPSPLRRTLFVNSGSEAVEAALFVAASYHQLRGDPRTRIVTLDRGYHGSTLLARTVSGLPTTAHPLRDPLPVTRVGLPVEPRRLREPEALAPFVAAVERALTADHPGGAPMAVLMEPFLNVGGGIVLPRGALRAVRELCDRTGALLVLDEVFTGFGRTGRMFARDEEDVLPDLLLTSKGLAGGYLPIGAVTARQEVYELFAADPMLGGLRHGHTTSGHAVACAAALATLDLLEREKLVERAAELGQVMLDGLAGLAGHGRILDVRGVGMVTVLETDSMAAATELVGRLRAAGLLLRQQGAVAMAVPPLIIDEEGVSAIVGTILEQAADGLEVSR